MCLQCLKVNLDDIPCKNVLKSTLKHYRTQPFAFKAARQPVGFTNEIVKINRINGM